jgi:serine protease inhibitor
MKSFTGKEKKLNKMVEKDTNKMIKNMFPPGSFDEMTSMVLLNTILFKGKWDESRGEFKKSDTKIAKNWYTGTKKILKVRSKQNSCILKTENSGFMRTSQIKFYTSVLNLKVKKENQFG